MGSSPFVPSWTKHNGTIIAVCGLNREAKLLERSDALALAGGGARNMLEKLLSAAPSDSISGVISIGICGGLDSTLEVGACVIASDVAAGSKRYAADAEWVHRLSARLPDARVAAVAGTDAMLISPEQKLALRSSTGAIAADMESHIAAEFAASRGFPFAVLRVVSDDASHALPPAVLKAMKPDGGVDISAIIGSLLRKPLQLPALIRTAWDSEIAFKALLGCLDRLGPRLMGPDFG
jgi:hopanoid-associated phosphorylase